METVFRRYALLILAFLLAAATPAAWAQAQAAGRFLSVTGDVAVVGSDGVRRNVERGGDIREGDTIVTGPEALAQARMSDGGLISVRPESQFKLEQFSYKGREDRSASFVVNILKGGFRTITGLIAQVNRSGYRIATPAATIGVRGTHFEVVHVLPQIASQQVPAGTYNRVFEGITTVQNPGGAVLQVVRDQTAFAALQGGTPTLVAPPALIFGRPTPVPRAAAPQIEERTHKAAAIKRESGALKMQGRALDRGLKREAVMTTPLESPNTVRSVPLTPIDTTAIRVAPSTTTISPTLSTTTTISPTLSTTTTLSPTTTTTTSTTTLTSPTLSTTTTLSPTTTTTTSTTTLSPSTSTILSPTTTTTTTIK